jgi:phosphopantetheinyl transferase (holo-ACP synthase)
VETSGVVLARVQDVVERRATSRPDALLSSRERERWSAIRHRGRRDEFLAARVLIKYLWCVPRPAAPPAQVRGAAREEIQGFLDAVVSRPPSLRRARMLQTLPGPSGAPELRWRGRAVESLSLSLTHAGGWVAVALSTEGRVGVDLETIEGRSPAFATVFSKAERAWSAAQVGVSPEASLTLLWALREAAFKAGLASGSGDEPFEIVPDGAAPYPSPRPAKGPWSLQSLSVTLPRGRAGMAGVLLDQGFVLARLAGDLRFGPTGTAKLR